MSESNLPNPIPQPPPPQKDPVVEQQQQSETSNAPPPEFVVDDENVEFPPGTVIAAQPISMVAPEDWNAAGGSKKAGKRRAGKDPTVRPSWLPENWGFETKMRTSGATRGKVDKYYYDPSGLKFRSKAEVMHFQETGTKLKRKPNSEGNAANPQPQGA